MTKTEVLALLKTNWDERGIRHWNESCAKESKLKSMGIGLTKLRKFAKQIVKDHQLAKQLWKSNLYDARIIALLIDDPKLITQEQAESQVEQLNAGHLAHLFSTCGALLAKTPFIKELTDKWIHNSDPIRRSCGFGLLHEMSKSKNKNSPDDSYFRDQIKHINQSFKSERTPVLMAMGHALLGIGSRNIKLNKEALKVAKKIGPIDFDPDGKCDPYDVVKHLTSNYLKKKLAS